MSLAFEIGGVEVPPGASRTIDLKIPKLYTHTDVCMPVRVVHGRREGPVLLVCAAIHGDEINGVEIIRRLTSMSVLNRIRGTLLAVPVVNVYGFIDKSRYLPDRRDLNRFFPGSERGSLTARLADRFFTEVLGRATHGIDLHTAANHRSNLPQIRAFVDDPEADRMAVAFGAPVILNSELRQGSLRLAARKAGIPVIVYEAGEALRFEEFAIRAGVKGVLAVMRDLGMLLERERQGRRPKPARAASSYWIRAASSGILRLHRSLGAHVEAGEMLGIISDPFGESEEPVVAPSAGLVVGRVDLPLVNEGEALLHVARVRDPTEAEERVDSYQAELAGASELADPTEADSGEPNPEAGIPDRPEPR